MSYTKDEVALKHGAILTMMTLPPLPTGTTHINAARWHIDAYKYNGKLHYSLPATLVQDDGHCLWFRVTPDTHLHHVTRGWVRPIGYPSDMFFWREAWYNVYANYTTDRMLDHFYCNVGLPPRIADHTLAFVDIDLDVRIYPDGSVFLLDADEFDAHITRYAYPPQMQHNARLAVLDIIARWRHYRAPFDRLTPPV